MAIPLKIPARPADCILRVDGEEIADLYPFLAEVEVENARTQSAEARLRFETHRDEAGRYAVQDREILVPWRHLVIEVDFGDRRQEIMRGYIREVQADYPGDRRTSVRVHCQDESLLMDRQHRRRVWGAEAPTDDAAILAAILKDYPLKPHRDNGPGLAGLVLSQDQTDIAFLVRRAEANAYELMVRGGHVYFGPPRLEAEPQPVVRVYAGQDTHCQALSVKSDGHLPDAVAYDEARPASGGGIQVRRRVVRSALNALGPQPADSSGAGLPPFLWLMRGEGRAEPVELEALARRHADRAALRVRAEGELDGSRYRHVLRVGEPVAVDGIGSWLSGHYYVDSVLHRFDTQGYRQRFTLLRNAYGDNLQESAAGVLASVL